MKSFSKQVYEIVEQIPFGKVLSYGDIARIIGSPRAARQVGWAMRNCPDDLPWQRVVMADGTITGGEFAELRKAFLAQEDVPFLPDGRVDMKNCRWLGSLDMPSSSAKTEKTACEQ
ncbi:MAG: methylated-DNA--[protein]-cysteine S-methyltransferase [Oscillospiraceae bacterium]|nr:methylated-DNA--[protein]-cysteine S-methyltransferase [Oscillospiraceae bacterium]